MSPTVVTWTHDSRDVVTVTLERPERNNAYDGDMIAGLNAALDALSAGPNPRAVLIRGNGRHFQAGADLDWLEAVRSQDEQANLTASSETARAVDRLNRVPCPTIAVVQGACIGGGTGLLAACDIVLAADTAKFAISEVRWGLTAAIIIPQLVDAIGIRQLRRYALTGEMFSADDAMRIGLVHELVPDARLMARADEMLQLVLNNGPDAIAATKQHILDYAVGQITEAEFDSLAAAHSRKRQSEEAGEGIRSFREKRPASWAPET